VNTSPVCRRCVLFWPRKTRVRVSRRQVVAPLIGLVLCLPAALRAGPDPKAWDPNGEARLPSTEPQAGWSRIDAAQHAFWRDAIVENRYMTLAFSAADGGIRVYPKDKTLTDAALPSTLIELAPKPAGRRWRLVGKERGELQLVSGEAADQPHFYVGSKLLRIKSTSHEIRIRVRDRLRFGLIPALIGDDLRFDPRSYSNDVGRVWIPSENAFLGLATGEARMLVCVWPEGGQKASFTLGRDPKHGRVIDAFEIVPSGTDFFLATVSRPGIWHLEKMDDGYRKREVRSTWHRPFNAERWRVQLALNGVWSSLQFRDKQGERGVFGHKIASPAWFRDGNAYFTVGKGVSTGDALVYPLGPKKGGTVDTPLDLMYAALGKETTDRLLDASGQWTDGRRRLSDYPLSEGYPYLDGSYTCHVKPVLYAVLDAGRGKEEYELVRALLYDMLTFTAAQRSRIFEFFAFADELAAYCDALHEREPDLADRFAGIRERVYRMQALRTKHADELDRARWMRDVDAILAVIQTDNPETLEKSSYHARRMHNVGSLTLHKLLPNLLAQTRKIHAAAGHACAERPDAVAVCQEIRKRTRKCLRRPFFSHR